MSDAPTTQAEQEDAVREAAIVDKARSICAKHCAWGQQEGRACSACDADKESDWLQDAADALIQEGVAHLRTERDQLAADLRKAREADWQPIATATKSSDQILLYGNLKGSPERAWYIGKWFCCGSYGGGWWVSSSVEVEATHWSPLPSPPALTPDLKDAGGTAKGEDHGA